MNAPSLTRPISKLQRNDSILDQRNNRNTPNNPTRPPLSAASQVPPSCEGLSRMRLTQRWLQSRPLR